MKGAVMTVESHIRDGEHAEAMEQVDVPAMAERGWRAVRTHSDGEEYIEAELYEVKGHGIIRLDFED